MRPAHTCLAPALLKAKLEHRRAPLRDVVERLEQSGGGFVADVGLSLGKAHAAMLDAVLREVYPLVVAACGAESVPLTLAGVGGYGRGAVALGADLDVRLLTADLARAAEVAETLLYTLWDAGLDVGHQVVTADDLLREAATDLPTATSLLDWRCVAGDAAPSETLRRLAREGIFSTSELPRFLDRLADEVRQRHARYGGSVYLLEPDVKNGPGGLRDLDIARWACRARWGVRDLDELMAIGVLVPRQLRAVEDAREKLWRIRNVLHARAERRNDRLGFDEQEALAPLLGYGGRVAPTPGQGDGLLEAVERLMSDYYRAARTISRFRDTILTRAVPAPRQPRPRAVDIGQGMQLFDGQLTLVDLDRLAGEPATALGVVATAVHYGVSLRSRLRNAIIDLCGDEAWTARLRADRHASALFVKLTTQCAETRLRAGSILRELHDTGLLLAMVPEFGPVVGRVHHDTYHVYTVDVHSVAAVDRLVEIFRGEVVLRDEQEQPWDGSLACRLAQEITRPHVVFFATLLHDIGKTIGRRDHSERGGELARVILARLGFEEHDAEDVVGLIEQHLTMYLTATRRDLDDPATIEEFARAARGPYLLRDLYLLTVADLSTTSPTSMTSWKAHMLDELYVATAAHFRDHPRSAQIRLERRREEVLRVLADGSSSGEEGALPAAAASAFAGFLGVYLEAMPPRYMLSTPPQAIVAHAALVHAHRSRGSASGASAATSVTVGLVPARHPEGVEIGVVAEDRPGLLAAITAALCASRLQVHGAQIHSCAPLELPEARDRDHLTLAVDVFQLREGSLDREAIERALPRLARDVEAVLAGTVSAAQLAARRPRGGRRAAREPRVHTRVILDNRASERHTVVEVVATDRPGLLFALASALHAEGVSVDVAKIVTEGTRVADVFYVRDEPDGKLEQPERAEAVRAALLGAVAALDAPPAAQNESRPRP